MNDINSIRSSSRAISFLMRALLISSHASFTPFVLYERIMFFLCGHLYKISQQNEFVVGKRAQKVLTYTALHRQVTECMVHYELVRDSLCIVRYLIEENVMAATSPFASPNEPEQRRAKSCDLPTGTVPLLFTDIEGSTHLLQQLGERYASVLAECHHLLRAAFREHHGHDVDTQGDAFFVTFARANDAVSAAVAAQRSLAAHPWPEEMAVRVRMSPPTGAPVLTLSGYLALGGKHPARIMSAGHG